VGDAGFCIVQKYGMKTFAA
jgi:hypothetical protein